MFSSLNTRPAGQSLFGGNTGGGLFGQSLASVSAKQSAAVRAMKEKRADCFYSSSLSNSSNLSSSNSNKLCLRWASRK
mgnify:CR=1 FL=1